MIWLFLITVLISVLIGYIAGYHDCQQDIKAGRRIP